MSSKQKESTKHSDVKNQVSTKKDDQDSDTDFYNNGETSIDVKKEKKES